MWVELTRANLEYLKMAVLVNAGKHEGSDASRKWHAGKWSKWNPNRRGRCSRARVRREAKENKRRRLPSSDTDGKDDDDEEHHSDDDGGNDSEVSAHSVTDSHS